MVQTLLSLLSRRSLLRVNSRLHLDVLNAVRLHCALYINDTTARARNGAADSDDIEFRIHLDNVKVLDGHLLNAQVTRPSFYRA